MTNTQFYLRFAAVALITGYHLMEVDMLKISFSAFLEEMNVIDKNHRSKSIQEFSNLYSKQLIVGIPATLIWGYLSDKYGSLITSVVHLFAHIGISYSIGMVTDYSTFTWLYVLLCFFSNYTISLSTFMSWVPESRKVSFISWSQFWNGVLLQIAPLFAGYLVNVSGNHLIKVYHTVLATILLVLNLGLIYVFRSYKEEVHTITKKEEKESEDMKGLQGYVTILKDKSAVSLLFLGIYLRLVKKLVDVSLHLWAEIGTAENGLGFDKATLGTYSSVGGILSVILYLFLSNEQVSAMPRQLSISFLSLAGCIFCFPFLALLEGPAAKAGLVLLILVFNYAFLVLFSVWIGLINVGVRKEIKAKSFAMTLAIRSIIGSYVSYLSFELMQWSLSSKQVTRHLGGNMNAAVFFWVFALINVGMYFYFRNLKLVKEEKSYRLVF